MEPIIIMEDFEEFNVGDTVTVTITAKITDVTAGSIEIEGGSWFSTSDADTTIVKVS